MRVENLGSSLCSQLAKPCFSLGFDVNIVNTVRMKFFVPSFCIHYCSPFR